MLHEEIGRLPDRYRTPVVLCYLEGLSHEQVARQLGWPIGTVGVRLMRARERLRDRLTRRGLAPTTTALLPLSLRSAPPATLFTTQTARRAISFISRTGPRSCAVPSQVANIALEVLRTMAIKKVLLVRFAAILASAACSRPVRCWHYNRRPRVREPPGRPPHRPRSAKPKKPGRFFPTEASKKATPRPRCPRPGRRGQDSPESSITGTETSPIKVAPACICGKQLSVISQSPSGFRR